MSHRHERRSRQVRRRVLRAIAFGAVCFIAGRHFNVAAAWHALDIVGGALIELFIVGPAL